MKIYKIKLEDKAAFLNRLEKAEVAVNSNEIEDNKFEEHFTYTTSDSKAIEVINTILKQSPKINDVKENKLRKSDLIEIIKKSIEESLAVQKTSRIFNSNAK